MLPDRVIVGPYVYTILHVAPADESDAGETLSDQLIIRITPDLPQPRARATLFHELLHACMDLIGNPLTSEQEEDLVNRLAPALVDLLDRNPALRG